MNHMRALALRSLVAAAVVALAAHVGQSAPSTTPRVLRVTSAADDNRPGTLRSAITASNATADLERIELDVQPQGPIMLTAALPPLRGPVQIEGLAWKRTGEYTVIDGSGYIPAGGPKSCPGATPGQYGANVRTMTSPGLQILDTAGVEIAGVEFRRFCIGVLINRSKHVLIRDGRFTANRGGAGIMLTGDDGQGNPTSTTTVHNKVLRNEFVDNGDGLELTRGAAFNLIADNVFRSTSANPEPSQGIEILRGNDNVVSGNQFEGYSDGLQINWGDRNYIVANTFRGNTFGLNLTGAGNIVDGNVITSNRIGIVVRPADPAPIIRLTRNRIHDNGQDIARCEAGGTCDPAAPKGAMMFGLPGLEHTRFIGSRGRGVTPNPTTLQHICPERAPECQPAPNGGLRAPVLTSVRARGGDVTVSGTLTAAPASRYVVELFGNTRADGAESEVFLDAGPIFTDAAGHVAFTVRVSGPRLGPAIQAVTATATSADGATSPLSAALTISDALVAFKLAR
jgi:3-dehydroshikimate dehydratase